MCATFDVYSEMNGDDSFMRSFTITKRRIDKNDSVVALFIKITVSIIGVT